MSTNNESWIEKMTSVIMLVLVVLILQVRWHLAIPLALFSLGCAWAVVRVIDPSLDDDDDYDELP